MDSVDDVIEHYGVRGMKWGVRRSGSGSGKIGLRSPKPPAHDDATAVKGHKKTVKRGSTDALSTKELQTLVTRMNLEQQYSKLKSNANEGKVNKGKKIVKNTITVGKTLQEIHSMVNSPLGKQLKSELNKPRSNSKYRPKQHYT